MDTGGARVRFRMKLCPFRKIRVTTALNQWEEQFQSCYREQCAMWIGSNCGFARANTVATPPVEVPDLPNAKSETESPTKSSAGNETNDLTEAIIKVLEAKETKNGSTRAWCQFEDGTQEAVFGKNSTGKNLLESISKVLKIKYRRLQNGTIFAVFAVVCEPNERKKDLVRSLYAN